MNSLAMEAFRNFRPSHEDAWVFEQPDILRLFEMQILNFPSYALPDPERPTALCGIVGMFGAAEVWMLKGENFRRSAPAVLTQMQELCAGIVRAWTLHRLEMRVVSGRTDAVLWALRVGFEYETTLSSADPLGRDLDIFLWPQNKGEKHE